MSRRLATCAHIQLVSTPRVAIVTLDDSAVNRVCSADPNTVSCWSLYKRAWIVVEELSVSAFPLMCDPSSNISTLPLIRGDLVDLIRLQVYPVLVETMLLSASPSHVLFSVEPY